MSAANAITPGSPEQNAANLTEDLVVARMRFVWMQARTFGQKAESFDRDWHRKSLRFAEAALAGVEVTNEARLAGHRAGRARVKRERERGVCGCGCNQGFQPPRYAVPSKSPSQLRTEKIQARNARREARRTAVAT